MPQTRTNYPVATSTVLFLAVVAFGLNALRPHIPPEAQASRLVAQEEDYLEVGTTQGVPWQSLSADAFAEARRLDRPVLVVVGDVASRSARQADAEIFTHPEVVDDLRAGFVCVRVDASQLPAWRSAWLPARGRSLGRDPLFQVWVLEPDGTPINGAMTAFPDPPMNQFWMGAFLRNSLQLRREALRPGGARPPMAEMDEEDRMLTMEAPLIPDARPDLRQHFDRLRERIDPAHGGFLGNGLQIPQPTALELVLRYGSEDAARAVIDPMLASGLVDWMDGGFRRRANQADWTGVEFDQHATQIGDLMVLCARYAGVWGDARAREAARRAQEALLTGFRDGSFVRAYRIGDEDERGRSARSSFAPYELRGRFSARDREFLRDVWGMRVEDNPQMVPRAIAPAAFGDEAAAARSQRVFQRLAEDRPEPRYGGGRQLDAAGDAVARLLEAARLLGDAGAMARAGDLVDPLRSFRVGEDDVRHSLRVGGTQSRCLADYLAYADAMLQDYLAFGRLPSLIDGRRVLVAAFRRFGGAPGVLLGGEALELGGGRRLVPGPPLADDLGESATAAAIRLTGDYGDLEEALRLPPVPDATPLSQRSADLAARNAPVVDAWPDGLSGIVLQGVRRGAGWVAVTGPGAVARANRLARSAPLIRVMPLVGELQPGWDARPPGVYRVRGGQVDGPLDDAAFRALAARPGATAPASGPEVEPASPDRP